MRVMIHMGSATGQRTGIGHYTWELARALARAAPGRMRPFPTPVEARLLGWYEGQARRYEAAADGARRRWHGRLLAAARRLGAGCYATRRARVAGRGVDLYHEPFFMPADVGVPAVATVHDLSAVLHPEWHRAETVAAFDTHFAAGLARCRHLLAISEFGKREIVTHLGWPADRVTVTYMGVRPGLRAARGGALARGLKALDLRPGYLLHVGTLEPRKNLPMLLRAYHALPAAVREKHPLVLAGGPGWKSEAVHDYLRGPARADNVRWLGYVPDARFGALYAGARALVFPTFYEGFGMPTIEMLACGGAVLASTAGAVAETVGRHAHLIDPHDEAGWRDAMLRVCTDDDWQRDLRAGAEDAARPFTWERCADATLAAYRAALGAGAGAGTKQAA